MWLWSKWKKTIPSFSLTGNEKTQMRNPCVQNPPCASKSAGFSTAIDNSDLWKQMPYVITWLSYVQDEQRRENFFPHSASFPLSFSKNAIFLCTWNRKLFPIIFDLCNFWHFIPLIKINYQIVAHVSIFSIKFQMEKKFNQYYVYMLCALLPLVVNWRSYKNTSLFLIKIQKINQCLRYEGMYHYHFTPFTPVYFQQYLVLPNLLWLCWNQADAPCDGCILSALDHNAPADGCVFLSAVLTLRIIFRYTTSPLSAHGWLNLLAIRSDLILLPVKERTHSQMFTLWSMSLQEQQELFLQAEDWCMCALASNYLIRNNR